MLDFKSCILMLLLAISVRIVHAKKGYNLKLEKIQVVKDPTFLLQIKEHRVSKYNDTTNVIQGQFTYTDDLPLDTMIKLTAYQLLNSNKYSMIPVGLPPVRYCDIMANDKEFYPTFLEKSNFPEKCPVLKGNFWMKDYIVESPSLPEELPGERWRLDVEMKSKRRTLAKVHYYIYIDRNI